MDKEEARDKEAERTLKRIKQTLHDLDQGTGRKDPMQNQEFKWMKQLVESGYQHPPRHWKQRLPLLIRHPVAIVFAVLVVGLVIFSLSS